MLLLLSPDELLLLFSDGKGILLPLLLRGKGTEFWPEVDKLFVLCLVESPTASLVIFSLLLPFKLSEWVLACFFLIEAAELLDRETRGDGGDVDIAILIS